MPLTPEERTLIFGADIDLTQFNSKLTQMAQGVTNFGINYTAQLEKLTSQQVSAGKRLEQSQTSLKTVSDDVIRKQDELRNSVGKNEAIYKSNQASLQKSIDLQKQLTEEVANTQKEYDQLGVRIGEVNKVIAERPPVGTPGAPGGVAAGLPSIPEVPQSFAPQFPQLLQNIKGQFDQIGVAVATARQRMSELNKEDEEYKQLAGFVEAGDDAIAKYTHAVELASQTTEQLGQRITNAKTTIQTIKTTQIEELPVVIAKSRKEIEDLSDSVALAENRLKKMNPEDSGFNQLAKEVANGKNTLNDYTKAIEQTNIQQTTFRTQMIAGQQALAKMVEEGKEGTKEFNDLQTHVARLTREYRVQHEQLRVLSSETRALDFGKAAIQGAVQGFQAYTAITILAGDESEKMQKKTMQLFAAMQLLTALEGVANTVRKGSIINTELLTGVQSLYTAAIAGTTGALRVFRIALLSTGIGAAVVAIGFLVAKYIQLTEELKRNREVQKAVNDARKEGIDNSSKEIADVQTLYKVTQDTTQTLKTRREATTELVKINKENNERTGEHTKLLVDQNGILKQNDTAINTLTSSLFKQAYTKAFLGVIEKAYTKLIEAQTATITSQTTVAGDFIQYVIGGFGRVAQNQIDLAEKSKKNAQDLVNSLQKIFSEGLKSGQFDLAGIFGKPGTTGKTVENVFEKEKADLEAKLAEARKDEILTVTKINNEFAAKLETEKVRIEKEIKEGKLTKAQGKIIFDLTVQLNRKEADEAIAEFTKKFKDEQTKLEEEIRVASVKAQTEQINLIQDEFTRRGKLIEVQQREEIKQEQIATDAKLKKLIELHKSETISEEQYAKDRDAIINNGELEINNTIRKYNQQREQLSLDTFKSILAQTEQTFHDTTASIEHGVTEEIVKQSKLFQSGEISYKQFTDSIEKTKLESDKTIRDASIRSTEEELLRVNLRLDTTRDTTSKGYKELVALRKKLQEDLDKQRTEDAEKDAKEIEQIKDKRIAAVQAWANAVGNLIGGVTEAFAEANRIEEQSLDRSIALQEKRVEEARRIADKGNAAYLKDEQDRLKKLQVEREAAAKKELAINAVIQESQAVVAVISAIAQGAKVGGALAAAIDAAAIIGLIASTFALVKSLTPPPPTFEKGTTFVERGDRPSGRDTIPAMLDEGEAVLPRDRNRDYHPSVEAIYGGSVPAEHLNKFVTIYQKERDISKVINTLSTIHNIHNVPQVVNRILTPGAATLPVLNHEKLQRANETRIETDGKLGSLLEEQNRLLREDIDLHRQTQHVLKHMGVDFKFDKNGVSVMLMKAIEQKKIDLKT